MNLFKTQEQLITEIHNAFDTAQDRLLSEANEILSKAKTDEQPIERLSERLKAQKFRLITNSKIYATRPDYFRQPK